MHSSSKGMPLAQYSKFICSEDVPRFGFENSNKIKMHKSL
jgi:hypothetical protein